MQVHKILGVGIAVALLAVGCNSNKNGVNNTPGNSSTTTETQLPPLETLLQNNPGVPSGWVPYEGDGFRLLIPNTWSRKSGVDAGNFSIGSNQAVSLAEAGAVTMDVAVTTKSAQTTLRDVVTGLIKGQQNATKLTESKTSSGLKVVSVSFGPTKGTITVYAIEFSDKSYVKVTVKGDVENQYVNPIVETFVLRGN